MTTFLGGNISVLVEISRGKLNELFYQVNNLHGTECPLDSSSFLSIAMVHLTARSEDLIFVCYNTTMNDLTKTKTQEKQYLSKTKLTKSVGRG